MQNRSFPFLTADFFVDLKDITVFYSKVDQLFGTFPLETPMILSHSLL